MMAYFTILTLKASLQMSYESFCATQKAAAPTINYSEMELRRLWWDARHENFYQIQAGEEETQRSIAVYKRFCYLHRGYENPQSYTEADLAAIWAAHRYSDYTVIPSSSVPETMCVNKEVKIRKKRISYLWAQHDKIIRKLTLTEGAYKSRNQF